MRDIATRAPACVRACVRASRESVGALVREIRVSLAALANGRLFKYSELSLREPFVPPRTREVLLPYQKSAKACRALYDDLNIRSLCAAPHEVTYNFGILSPRRQGRRSFTVDTPTFLLYIGKRKTGRRMLIN